MKKLLFFSIFIIFMTLILITIFNKPEQKYIHTENPSSASKKIYIIKEYNGNVAVFSDDDDFPLQILDCKTKSLPPDAAEALATGIEVSGEDELQKIIEAYD